MVAAVKLWLVGQCREGEYPHVVWDFQGVFSTREKALSACRNEHYFMWTVEVDQHVPDGPMLAPHEEWPLR